MQSRFFVSAIACVVALQMSPGIAAGGPGEGPVEVTVTKWRTAGVPPPPAVATRSLFAGNVGGDLGEGDFVGEVLDRKVSTPCTFTAPPCTPGTTPPTITESIASLQAIYEVQAGEHSFIALIQGGSNSAGGRLEGVIVSGPCAAYAALRLWRDSLRVTCRAEASEAERRLVDLTGIEPVTS